MHENLVQVAHTLGLSDALTPQQHPHTAEAAGAGKLSREFLTLCRRQIAAFAFAAFATADQATVDHVVAAMVEAGAAAAEPLARLAVAVPQRSGRSRCQPAQPVLTCTSAQAADGVKKAAGTTKQATAKAADRAIRLRCDWTFSVKLRKSGTVLNGPTMAIRPVIIRK